MKSYSIFIKKNDKSESIDDVILLKEGFNFYAFFFNIFWFLYNKLWICSLIYIILISLLTYFFSYFVILSINLLILIFVGLEANNFLIKKFQKNNYYFVGYSTGNDEKEAKLRFLDNVNKENKNNNKIIY